MRWALTALGVLLGSVVLSGQIRPLPVIGAVIPITGGTCTNQVVTAIDPAGTPTCTTVTKTATDTTIAGTGGDINTSSQVIASHLASALPVAQGGLGLTTLAAHNVYVGNGTSAPTAVPGGTNCVLSWPASTSDPTCSLVISLATLTHTTADTAFPIFTGVTNATTYYAKSSVSADLTAYGGVGRGAGFLSYYKYAPADSTSGGVARTPFLSYIETGGSQALAGSYHAQIVRTMNLGTGAVAGGLYGVNSTVFNGHAGVQGSTGGNIPYMVALRGDIYQQSSGATVTDEYGVDVVVENDYATAVTRATGYNVAFYVSNGVMPVTAYGYYVDVIQGTTKYGFYNNDATAASVSKSNWQAPFHACDASTTLASGTTITPTTCIHHVSGVTTIATITVPAMCAPTCSITLIPDGVFLTTTVGGNIGLVSTSVVGKALTMTWDGSKWYPSY